MTVALVAVLLASVPVLLLSAAWTALVLRPAVHRTGLASGGCAIRDLNPEPAD